jgi:hypothetical protein
MTCRFRRQLGVGSFFRAIKKKYYWLPTMATHWAKQLSLSKEMNSDQDSKEKFQLKNNNQKIVPTSTFTIFSSYVLKDANQ